jgi:Zn-dependent peptidase ImmA (M78 family)/transcriptional regulator with XRE-family HTH domain
MDDTTAILERINDALHERALTQVELAEQTGLSTTQMSRLLSGQRKLTAGELGVLADALGVSASRLLGRSEPERAWGAAARLGQAQYGGELAGPFLRAQHLVELRDRLSRTVATDGRASGVDVAIPTTDYAKTAGRQLAERVRKALNIGGEPVTDLTALVEDVFGLDVAVQPLPNNLHGLLVTDQADQPDGADAAQAPAEGSSPGAVALINSSDTWGRQRFTLAHELSHLLFMDMKLFVADFAGRAGRDLNELRADCFAAHFLAPDSGLKELARGVTGRDTVAGLPLADVDAADGATLVTAVAVRFGVSVETALHRLDDARIIDAEQKAVLTRRAARELFLAAGRKREWDEQVALQHAVVPPPGLLGQALFAYQQGMLSVQTLADLYDTDDVAALEGELASTGWSPAAV